MFNFFVAPKPRLTVNVLLFTNDEPLYMPGYLQPVFEAHATRFQEVIAVPFNHGLIEEAINQLRMLGPSAGLRFAGLYLRRRLLDLLGLRDYSVRSVAETNGPPVRTVRDINDPDFVDHVRSLEPDVILSIICGQKISQELLNVPDEAINVHGSLLPRYRGRGTAFWPLYYDDEESGVTAHRMTTKLDAGPIFMQRSFPIEPEDSIHDIYMKIAETGSDLVVDLVYELMDGDLEAREMRVESTDYLSIPSPEQRREFREGGNRFL